MTSSYYSHHRRTDFIVCGCAVRENSARECILTFDCQSAEMKTRPKTTGVHAYSLIPCRHLRRLFLSQIRISLNNLPGALTFLREREEGGRRGGEREQSRKHNIFIIFIYDPCTETRLIFKGDATNANLPEGRLVRTAKPRSAILQQARISMPESARNDQVRVSCD